MYIGKAEYERMKEANVKLNIIRRYCLNADNPDADTVLLIIGSTVREPITDETHFCITEEGEKALQFNEIG